MDALRPADVRYLDVEIMRRKAVSVYELFNTSERTPRKVDKLLWASERACNEASAASAPPPE